MTDLEKEVKELIIESLQLEDVSPDDIAVEDPLFNEGLGLDSIDALELGIAVQKKYDVTFSENSDDNKSHFASVRALATYIEQNKG